MTFDEDGDPVGVVLEGILTNGGPVSSQRCVYTLVAADVTAINSVIANAKTFCGIP